MKGQVLVVGVMARTAGAANTGVEMAGGGIGPPLNLNVCYHHDAKIF